MAIFGDFSDFTMSDILKIVQKKTGTLYLYSALGGRSLELSLNQNHLMSIFVDGFPVTQPDRAVGIVQQLVQEAHGKFTFESAELSALPMHFMLALAPVAEQRAARAVIPEAELPHPLTVFRACEPLPEVPAALSAQWVIAEPYVRSGVNGEELAQALGLSTQGALTLLYRWRSAGLTEPQRGGSADFLTASASPHTPSTSPAPARVTAETRGILRRLLGRLRGQPVA